MQHKWKVNRFVRYSSVKSLMVNSYSCKAYYQRLMGLHYQPEVCVCCVCSYRSREELVDML